ncbi:MAG: amidohydrolase [Geminicoccaceae bacterium]|nr:amidohydrolase [Geminicoccaceae bacterium]MCB9945043.1 amidohydrolase [Geminicoccaceae bacterium]
MPIVNRVAEFHDDMTAWRRHLHANPELGYEEVMTSAFVSGKLQDFGVDEIHEGVGRTGVVGVIRGGDGQRRVGLRADMDALPIQEATGVPHASKNPGKMHACGHDGHTTMLLGAARYLAETRNFNGTVYLYFQPAEEGRAGAKAMIDDGLFERFPAEAVFGLHNWPSMPVGVFGMCKGPAMAASDEFRLTLSGKGSHAAMPQASHDPVVAGAAIVQALQTIVSRQIDPIDNAVVSVTQFVAGDTFNVIPETALLGGTVRTFNAGTRDFCEKRLREIAGGIAATMGVECDIFYRRGYPPMVNHERESDFAADSAAEIVGEDKVQRNPHPVMGAEDFAFMLEEKPGSYIWLGTGGAEQGKSLHSPHFDFNDEVLPIGASYWVRLVERLMAA